MRVGDMEVTAIFFNCNPFYKNTASVFPRLSYDRLCKIKVKLIAYESDLLRRLTVKRIT